MNRHWTDAVIGAVLNARPCELRGKASHLSSDEASDRNSVWEVVRSTRNQSGRKGRHKPRDVVLQCFNAHSHPSVRTRRPNILVLVSPYMSSTLRIVEPRPRFGDAERQQQEFGSLRRSNSQGAASNLHPCMGEKLRDCEGGASLHSRRTRSCHHLWDKICYFLLV